MQFGFRFRTYRHRLHPGDFVPPSRMVRLMRWRKSRRFELVRRRYARMGARGFAEDGCLGAFAGPFFASEDARAFPFA
jgi:hypothetical protein